MQKASDPTVSPLTTSQPPLHFHGNPRDAWLIKKRDTCAGAMKLASRRKLTKLAKSEQIAVATRVVKCIHLGHSTPTTKSVS